MLISALKKSSLLNLVKIGLVKRRHILYKSISKKLYSRNVSFIPKKLNTTEMIRSQNYPAEEHTIRTDDGYILKLHRIPGKKGSQPIIFMHGMLASSSMYLLPGPDNALPFMAFDAGFDIWLGNNRGNYYSKHHVSLDANSEKFWNFSFHEMGLHDLPASIDYVLGQTGSRQVELLAFSQGTTQSLVLTSQKPDYNQKIKRAFLLAPVSFLGHSDSRLIRQAASLFSSQGGGVFGIREFASYDSIIKKTTIRNPMLVYFLEQIHGPSRHKDNWDLFFQHKDHFILGSSTKQFYHYSQLIKKAGFFGFYDYGGKENLTHYQDETPPQYALNKSTMPIVLIHGSADPYGHPKDINLLKSRLLNVKATHCIEGYNHLDLILDKNVKGNVNQLILYDYLLK